MSAASTTTIETLEARIEELERSRFQQSRNNDTSVEIVVDESVRRARIAVEEQSKCCYSAIWKWVPAPYYRWTLQQRAECLGASSIHQLCKSLLMENRKHPGDDISDPTNPKFVLVVIQYAATLDVKKLTNVVRALRTNVQERIDSTQFEWRIASTDDNKRITGYEFNSVTPFGLLQPQECLIIVSSAVVPYHFFWMGGGHVHLK